MYSEHFHAASDYLRGLGMTPVMKPGTPVSSAAIDEVDLNLTKRMPRELRHFYLELGDGFQFKPGEELAGWEPIWLSDHVIHNRGFDDQIEEEAAGGLQRSAEPSLLRAEAERRKNWICFYGFIGGGDLLCLDESGAVRFYEALFWRACPSTWDFSLAPSFTEFVQRWSRYCFVSPAGGWTSFCSGRSGEFDWAPAWFASGVDRGPLSRD